MPADERDDEATQALTPEETEALDADETKALSASETEVLTSSDADDATRRVDAPPPSEPAPTRRMSSDTVISPAPARPPAAYATERIAVPQRASLGPWLVALIVLVALAIGTALGYSQTRPSDKNVVARALVSPNGGVMRFDGSGRLTVPKGALSSPTAITIRRMTVDHPVRLGTEDDPRSVTYEAGELVVYAFEPSDLRFQQPVTIELPRTGDGSAVFVDVRGSPHVVPGQTTGKTVTIQTLSFSFSQDRGTTP